MLHRLALRVLPSLSLAVTEDQVRKRKRWVMFVPGILTFGLYRLAKHFMPLSEPFTLLAVSGVVAMLTAAWAYRIGRDLPFTTLLRADRGRRVAWLLGWIGFAYGVQLSLLVLTLLWLVGYDYLKHPDGPAMMAIIIACTAVARDAFEIGHVRRLEASGRPFPTFPDGTALRTLVGEQGGQLVPWLVIGVMLCAGVAVIGLALDRAPVRLLVQLGLVTLAAGSVTVCSYFAGQRRDSGWVAALTGTSRMELLQFWWWPGLAFASTYFLVLAGSGLYLARVQSISAVTGCAIAGLVGGMMALYGYYLGHRRQVEDRMRQTVPASVLRCPFVMGILGKVRVSPARLAWHRLRRYLEKPDRKHEYLMQRCDLRTESMWIALAVVLSVGSWAFWGPAAQAGQVEADTAADLYYKTEGTPIGLPAPAPQQVTYPRYGSLDNRLLVWFVTQQHTYFGGFVLALPIFCVLLEFMGLATRNPALSLRYDGLARDLLKVALLALSITAIVGSLMLGLFIALYPSFMVYMGNTFKSLMPVYALVFVGESLLLILYYYSWDRMVEPGIKWIHAAIGIVSNVFGTALLLLANAWAAFMMAPAGIDAQGRFLGNTWHLLHSALWNPLNVHRFLADIMSGGAVVLAYACYRFFTSKSREERAYYDWVGYIFLFVTVCALLPMPFAGYWLMRSVYAFSQRMGMTMMGGLLTWLFVVQALLIGTLFLGINYYLWQSMGRLRGGERYQPYFQMLLLGLMVCLFIWLTPHTVMVSASEMKAMGGAQHPVVGNYGVMSAKNGAVNVMICLTALSYIFYRRANRTMAVLWIKKGNLALTALFGLGMLNIIWLAIYGFYLPASVRVGLSGPQALTTLTVVVGGILINHLMLRRATVRGPVQWGNMPVRGMVGLFALAASFSWVMGLMGYIRSSGRLSWHVNEVMPDVSPWAFTPSLGFAAKMVTLNMVVFWSAVLVLFWLSQRGQQPVWREEWSEKKTPAFLASPSEEV